MNITDYVWEWAFQKEERLVFSLFSFGEALELLSCDPLLQIDTLEGECPFLTLWYNCCCEVLSFREKLNNRSLSSFYDEELHNALDVLSQSFEELAINECAEGTVDILYMNGWCKIRSLSKLPLTLIHWELLRELKGGLYKVL